MSQVIVVRKDRLHETPKAFQQYVTDWFKAQKVLGIDCMVASSCIWSPRPPNSDKRWEKGSGVAPGHSVDVRQYEEGVGGDLLGWIRKADPEIVFTYVAAEPYSEPFYDD